MLDSGAARKNPQNYITMLLQVEGAAPIAWGEQTLVLPVEGIGAPSSMDFPSHCHP
jgi:hypothetical protein